MLWETVKLAMSSIRRNVLRSVLTLLGIVIGVGAVIAMVTLGNGASSKVQDNLAKLGSNMLIVRPGQTTFGPGGTTDARSFDERDVTALKNDLSGIRGVAPTAQKQMKVVSGALNYDATVNGTNADWFTVQDWTMEDGRVFSESELRAGASVCVIGATIRWTGGASPGLASGMQAQKIEFIVSITRLVICTPLGRPVVPPELIRMATSSGASPRSGALSGKRASHCSNSGPSRQMTFRILGQASRMRGSEASKLEW